MVDYAAWANADTLTVEQAAYLWAGMDPSSLETLTSHQRSAVGPFLQMIQGAIAAGELAADSRLNAFAAVGNFASSLVGRGDLMKFAEARGERPSFLFYPPAPKRLRPDAVLASDLLKLGIIHPDSKLLKIATRYAEEEDNNLREAMDRAEMRTNMPRRGREARTPNRLNETSTAKVGGKRRINDDMHIAQYRTEKMSDPNLSVRSFVLARDKEIEGVNIHAKVRRLQDKLR
jgi:hypothetical protein